MLHSEHVPGKILKKIAELLSPNDLPSENN